MFSFQSERYPNSPGVYFFQDERGKIIYVGKANDLRKRLSSYFRPSGQLPDKTRVLVTRINKIEYLCTNTEKEALLLEASLIKKHKPKYNIVLRDDKSYILFKLDKSKDYPRLTLTRTVKKDGSLYFGPFTSAHKARETLRFLNNYFPLIKCKETVFKNRTRPCLQYNINRCLAPCVFKVSKQHYRKLVRQVEVFLEQGSNKLLQELTREMHRASEALDFEKAAELRDQIQAIQKTVEEQTVVFPEGGNKDIIGMSRNKRGVSIGVLFIRQGKLLDSKTFCWETEDDTDAGSPEGKESENNSQEQNRDALSGLEDEISVLLRNFLVQYYAQGSLIPEVIVLPEELLDKSIQEVLTERRGGEIDIHTPGNPKERKLMQMAKSNASQSNNSAKEKQILYSLRKKLKLSNFPHRIEAVDASHLSGSGVVVGQVVFEQGEPKKDSYRIYKFPELSGSFDDYAALSAWVQRRCESGPPWPDLVLIDGGKGQLGAVERTVRMYNENNANSESVHSSAPQVISWDLVSIAKNDPHTPESTDRIFLPGRKNPLNLKAGEKELLFLQNLRDNVHRFVLSKQKRIRNSDTYAGSVITQSGIGPKTAEKLWSHFGSVQEMKSASVEDLKSMQGIGEKKAQEIQNALENISP